MNLLGVVCPSPSLASRKFTYRPQSQPRVVKTVETGWPTAGMEEILPSKQEVYNLVEASFHGGDSFKLQALANVDDEL